MEWWSFHYFINLCPFCYRCLVQMFASSWIIFPMAFLKLHQFVLLIVAFLMKWSHCIFVSTSSEFIIGKIMLLLQALNLLIRIHASCTVPSKINANSFRNSGQSCFTTRFFYLGRATSPHHWMEVSSCLHDPVEAAQVPAFQNHVFDRIECLNLINTCLCTFSPILFRYSSYRTHVIKNWSIFHKWRLFWSMLSLSRYAFVSNAA